MADEIVMAEVMNVLEAEPAASLPAAVPDIPALREQLAILVSTGKCKEAIGVNLTHEQVRRLEDKDVIRHYKRYETYVGAKTTETLIDGFLLFSTKAKKRLHHHKRAVQSFWQPCAEMWPFARFGQRVFDHSKTCRFQR